MDNSHDLRSLRSWLNAIYPDASILVQRNVIPMPKSYFFIQDVMEQYQDAGPGYYNMERTARIHLVTEGNSATNPNTDTYWKTRAVIDGLASRLNRYRVINSYLYNWGYLPPHVYSKGTGTGTFADGTYRLAVTALDYQGKETMISEETTFVEIYPLRRFYVNIPNWPLGTPFAASYNLYTRANPTAPWLLVRNIPIDVNNKGNTTVEITSLATTAVSPPTTSKTWFGHLKIQEASCTMTESMNVDDVFHGFVAIKYLSRNPRYKSGGPSINTLNQAQTINTLPISVP